MGNRVYNLCGLVIATPDIFRIGAYASEASGIGGPVELACHDLRILGTIAAFAGENGLWDLIGTWTEEKHPVIPGARP